MTRATLSLGDVFLCAIFGLMSAYRSNWHRWRTSHTAHFGYGFINREPFPWLTIPSVITAITTSPVSRSNWISHGRRNKTSIFVYLDLIDFRRYFYGTCLHRPANDVRRDMIDMSIIGPVIKATRPFDHNRQYTDQKLICCNIQTLNVINLQSTSAITYILVLSLSSFHC